MYKQMGKKILILSVTKKHHMVSVVLILLYAVFQLWLGYIETTAQIGLKIMQNGENFHPSVRPSVLPNCSLAGSEAWLAGFDAWLSSSEAWLGGHWPR